MIDGLNSDHLTRTLGDAAKHHAPLAVGFSGGGDSLALLVLCAHFAKKNAIPLHALIVDHALRRASADEAKHAAAQAQKLGASAHILRSSRPRAGHKHARAARYVLLAQACRAVGARGVLLAHTREDQAETFALRAVRGSGARGLACMRACAPFPLWPHGRGLCVWRPLLGTKRADLRSFLRQRGLNWIEDPSNQDMRYARVRVRHWLHSPAGAPFIDRFCHSARLLSSIEREQAKRVQNWAKKKLYLDPCGFARLPWRDFAAAPHATALRALGLALCSIAGRPQTPAPSALFSLLKALRAGRGGATLGGCYLLVQHDNLYVFRDPGAVLGRHDVAPLAPLVVAKGETAIFDNRFVVHAAHNVQVTVLAGRAAHLPQNQQKQLAALPAAARALLPVFTLEDSRLEAPILQSSDEIRFLGVQMWDHLIG